MRMRIPDRLEPAINKLALTQGRSVQETANRLLDAGLATTTGPRVDDLRSIVSTVQRVAGDVNVIADGLARHRQSIQDDELRHFLSDLESVCRKMSAEFDAAMTAR
jgi:hypothetical protein